MMARFQKVFRGAWLLGTAFCGLAPAQEFQITGLDPAGKLTFEGIPRAMEYRVEWSAAPGRGDWRREGLGITEVPVAGAGERTVNFSPRPAPCFYRVAAVLGPEGFVVVPAGTFQMGDSFSEAAANERPVHPVEVSAFLLQARETTKAEWDEVYAWALAHGYDFGSPGSGKAAQHPVHSVSWFDAVKWCNARSEMDGLAPCYFTDASHAVVYRTGEFYLTNGQVLWTADGYRLPTEAEWEKAARGGQAGKRFPWVGNLINHSLANYRSLGFYAYELPSGGPSYHPLYANGVIPYTAPVGSFAPNGYGLYDMAGNLWEWCWDLYGDYSPDPVSDPRGPSADADRIVRGGGWDFYAVSCRVAYRTRRFPSLRYNVLGFRTARRL